MNEREAYPCGRSYTSRALTEYQRGDFVEVGPAYQMGGAYRADEWTGRTFKVLRRHASGNDYELGALDAADGEGAVAISASRLTKVQPGRHTHCVAIRDAHGDVHAVQWRGPMLLCDVANRLAESVGIGGGESVEVHAIAQRDPAAARLHVMTEKPIPAYSMRIGSWSE